MKRIIICCILAAVIFAGGIIGVFYTSKVGNDIIENLERVRACYSSGDKESAKTAANTAYELWRGFREMHILIIDNDHALEITMSAERIKRLLEADNDEVSVECGVMEELIRVYCDEQKIRLGNVF